MKLHSCASWPGQCCLGAGRCACGGVLLVMPAHKPSLDSQVHPEQLRGLQLFVQDIISPVVSRSSGSL